MKLTFILLTVAFLQVSAKTTGQGITFSGKDVSLETVFSAIKKQTGFSFFYNNSDMQIATPVTINLKDAPLSTALATILENQSLNFTIEGKTIFISKKPTASTQNVLNAFFSPPPIDVRGKVTNENGEPVAGATVKVKGTSVGTTTDINGEFALNGIDEKATLVFSGTNIETFETKVNGRTNFDLTAKIKVASLNEVVINKGYYTEKMRYTVGNVATVKAADIEKQPVNNPLLALQGMVPGLQIRQANGIPGGGITVRIQGQNSIRAGNDPLYVIDGVPYPAQMLTTTSAGNNILGNSGASIYSPGGNGNPLSYINPSDIESIEILKDADATSIYGSRAANGAILITTKSGKAGPLKFDINLQQGWGKATRAMNVLNSEQYLEMRKEALANDGITIRPTDNNYDLNGLWDQNRNTDWVKTLIGRAAKYTNLNASISGGNAGIQYLVRGTYQRESTVFSGNYSDQKASMHFNINTKSPGGKFRLQFSGTYLADNNQLPRNDYTFQAYLLPPNAPELYKADGTLNWAPNLVGNSSWINPLSGLYQNYQNKTDNLVTSMLISYNISPEFEVSSRFGYTKLSTDEIAASLSLSQKPENRLPDGSATRAAYTNSEIKTLIIEPQMNYKRILGSGMLEVLLGLTVQKNSNDGQAFSGEGFATDALVSDIRSAKSVTVNSSVDAIYKYNAAFVRMNYRLKEKYIVNLTGRRDGSSRFGPENRFHNFASAGAAWIFSEEKFFKTKLSFLTFGKLRASYGITGNDQIGDYLFMDLYSSTNPPILYQAGSSLGTNRIPNPYLQWEETNKLSVGLDLGFLNDRISFSSVFGRNRSSNQLIPYSLPITAGFARIDRNFPATVQNINWEFIINSTNVKRKNFEWKSSCNFTVPRNTLIKFPSLENSSYAGALLIGQPLSIVQAYHFMGVDPATGIYQFEKIDGTLTSNPDFDTDRTVLINVDPKFYGGFQNSIRYKQFQLDMLFYGIRQTQTNAYNFGKSSWPGTFEFNQPVTVLNRWQKPGDATHVQRFGTGFNLFTPYSNALQSDAAYVDASYIRLENLSLSYRLSEDFLKKLHLRTCKLYVQGQNLLTISDFGGIDPENRSFGALAPLKIFTVGVQVTL